MRQKSQALMSEVEQTVRDIRRRTRKQYSAEEKIRIVLSGLRGEDSIASMDGAWSERQGDKLADTWRADLPTTAMVLRIQDGLASFGYPVGPVDGIVGPKTRGAIRSYQKRNGLTVDGQATGALQDHIVAQRLAMPN